MEKGRIVAIVGAIVGIVFVLLSLAIPEFLSWYRWEIEGSGYGYSESWGFYLTAFGTISEDLPPGYYIDVETAILVMIGGIMVLAGAGLCIVSAAIEMKPLAIVGGILMIVGPLMLIFDLVGGVSEFAEAMNDLADMGDSNVFFGSYSYTPYYYPGITIDNGWGLWIGFFIPFAAGGIGIIGGASM